MPTLVIIGAGFSGTACACQFLARCGENWTVHLINASGPVARGLAYGTRSPVHLLNVPAGRLGMDPEREGDFVNYLATTGRAFRASDFVPRMLYGEYLEARLREAASGHAGRLSILIGRVKGIARQGDGRFELQLEGGAQALAADRIILAMGHLSPVPPLRDLPALGARYVNDPWAPGAIDSMDADEDVLIIGTGLTMLDVVTDLARRGHRGQLTALSRRGLLPRSHRIQDAPPATIPLDHEALLASGSARMLVRKVREAVRQAARACIDWRDVIASLRAITPALWQSLNVTEQRRFMRHVRPYWEVMRHRTAPTAHRVMSTLLDEGRLRIASGRITLVQERPNGADVQWHTPSGGDHTITVARIINCTGPGLRINAQQAPLLHQLIADGLLSEDDLKLGLMVAPDCRAIDCNGHAVDGLYYVGPLLRAQFWEATAIPELRQHALRAVVHALQSFSSGSDRINPA